ncbi:glycosyltransferase [Chelativorans sp. Marseille-P2723]|uniref:glycosyltransferase n=1 Tax=Chelativorans sp. Marseille-P2723 TaxID=2709133 RepID=UPI00156FDEC5|nr:glycosyltransferase [Chelativorans sp. Marseille-P2723]
MLKKTDNPNGGKLLIVSSYRRSCGIAQYVEFLEGPLRAQSGWDIEIAALPVTLLRAQSPYAREAAAREMAEIVHRAKGADVVNIQLEPGLFGLTPMRIWKRLDAIIKASKKVLLTYHTVPSMQAESLSLSLRGLAAAIRSYRGNYVFDRLFRRIRQAPHKFHHIVQTEREARNFVLMGIPENTISHMPLAFLSKEAKQSFDFSSCRQEVEGQYGLKNSKIIACFGFLSEYKGIEVAIHAMRLLPPDYHLLIVGGLHPEGLATRTVHQPYIHRLVTELYPKNVRGAEQEEELISASLMKSLLDRVHFCGALGNDDFNKIMAACDAVVLPYAEVGQTSSGPASLALDLQRPLYCSRTHCFRELDNYQPGILSFFEIGNHVELAEKIMLGDAMRDERSAARAAYVQRYNVEARAALYIESASRVMQRA